MRYDANDLRTFPQTISRATGLPLADVLEEMNRAERIWNAGGDLPEVLIQSDPRDQEVA